MNLKGASDTGLSGPLTVAIVVPSVFALLFSALFIWACYRQYNHRPIFYLTTSRIETQSAAVEQQNGVCVATEAETASVEMASVEIASVEIASVETASVKIGP